MSEGKKKLSAREYLGQLEELDIKINQDLERLEEMKTDACNPGGIDYSRDRVQTSISGDKLGGQVTRYVTFNEYINAEIDRFADAKEQIISEIRGLHNRNYIQLLFKVYVQFKTLKVAADEMKMSYQYIRNVHKKALAAFEEMYADMLADRRAG